MSVRDREVRVMLRRSAAPGGAADEAMPPGGAADEAMPPGGAAAQGESGAA